MNILAQIIKQAVKVNKEYAFLVHTQRVSQFKIADVRESLEASYKPERNVTPQDKVNSKLFGTWLNSILSQGRYVFMNSYRTFNILLANDRNTKRNTLSRDEFKAFNKFLFINKFAEPIKEPTKSKSGVYRVTHPAIRNMLQQLTALETEKAQESQCLEIYAKNEELHQKIHSKPSQEDVLESEVENESVHQQEGELPEDNTSQWAGQANASFLKSESPQSPKKHEDLYASVPLVTKLSFILGSKTFLSMVAGDEKKKGYYKKFSDFAELLVKNVELTKKQTEMTIDWFGKIKRQDKSNQMIGYFRFLDEMAKVDLHLTLQVEDIEFIHDTLVVYYNSNPKTKEENDRVKKIMADKLTNYQQKRDLNEHDFWFFTTMMSNALTKSDPMEKINEMKAKRKEQKQSESRPNN